MLALALALTGIMAYLTQMFAERRHEMALRCALGGWTRDIWGLITRRAAPSLAIGTILAGLLGTVVMWLPDGMAPAFGLALWAAAAGSIAALWASWGAASWWASRHAATKSGMERLRHL
ncbi:membrane hypothetical protein [Candidatus Sulfopaludibacter sp. SbA3]|nr:membrane hypothetical protein [Candidatus Sulfopaludibacter sp. SbA3]